MSEQSGKHTLQIVQHEFISRSDLNRLLDFFVRNNISPEDRFDEFVEELRALCREHGVQLGVSGHDSILVFELDDGEDEITAPGIVNYLNASL
jgi:hypothetical protein